MRIYFNEVVKALCRKTTVGVFIVLTLLNGILIWVNENQNRSYYTASQYKAVFADIDGMNGKEAYEKLRLEAMELELIDSLSYGEDISDRIEEEPKINKDEIIKKYKDQSYLKYTENIFYERELVSDVLTEVESCANYGEYLNSIDKAAAKMTGISLFANPDTFSYKNITKTPEDFAHLKNSELEPAPSKGISMTTGFLATDIFGMLMIMTVAAVIVTREKELNQIVLSRTTFKGRASLGTAKLFTCFTAAFFAETILYAVNFSIAYFTYGFGNLNRQIQSVLDFNGSDLKISVLEYFVLFLLAKFAVYCLFAALIYFVTVISNSAVKVYGILALILAGESILYYTIPSESYLCPLKYINILAFSNTDKLLAQYLNLNLLGEPVNYLLVFVISAAVLLNLFSIFSVVVFTKQKAVKSRADKKFFEKINPFRGRNTSIFLHECYKIFIIGKVLPMLAVFAFAVVFFYHPMSETFSSADDVYYKNYMISLEGKYTSEKQDKIDKEDKKFSDARTEISEELAAAGDSNVVVIMNYQDILAPQYAFEKVKSHAEYLKKTQNGEFVYDSGYKLLTGDKSAGSKDITMGLTAMAMAICCLVYVYSAEYQTGANVLLKTSAKGRKSVFWCKFFIGMIIVTIIYFLTYAPYFYNVLHTYGTRGINAPICSMETFEDWSISIKAYLIFISILRYVALIITMLIIYFLSTKLKSVIGTFLVSTAVFAVPLLLSLLGIKFFDYVFLNPLIIGNL